MTVERNISNFRNKETFSVKTFPFKIGKKLELPKTLGDHSNSEILEKGISVPKNCFFQNKLEVQFVISVCIMYQHIQIIFPTAKVNVAIIEQSMILMILILETLTTTKKSTLAHKTSLPKKINFCTQKSTFAHKYRLCKKCTFGKPEKDKKYQNF